MQAKQAPPQTKTKNKQQTTTTNLFTILVQDDCLRGVLEKTVLVLIVHVTLVLPFVLLLRELDGEEQVGVAEVVQVDLVSA